jgi:hypothetical protein
MAAAGAGFQLLHRRFEGLPAGVGVGLVLGNLEDVATGFATEEEGGAAGEFGVLHVGAQEGDADAHRFGLFGQPQTRRRDGQKLLVGPAEGVALEQAAVQAVALFQAIEPGFGIR